MVGSPLAGILPGRLVFLRVLKREYAFREWNVRFMISTGAQKEADCPLCRDLFEGAQVGLHRLGELLDAQREAMAIGAENLWMALNRELEREFEAHGCALKALADHRNEHEG